MDEVIVFDLVSIAILFLIILGLYYKPHWKTRYFTLFKSLGFILFIASIVEIFGVSYLNYSNNFNIDLFKFIEIVYFILLVSFSFFNLYMLAEYYLDIEILKKIPLIYILNLTLVFITSILAFFTNIFYSSNSNFYLSKKLFVVAFFAIIINSLFCLKILHKNKNKLKSVAYLALVFFAFTAISSLILNFLKPNLLIFQYLMSIYLLLIYIFIYSEESYLKSGLAVFNYESFKKRVYYKLNYDVKATYFYVFSLDNLISGEEENYILAKELILSVLGKKLSSLFKNNVYSLSTNRYIVECSSDSSLLIKENFINNKLKFKVKSKTYYIKPLIGYFQVPQDFSYAGDIINASKDKNFIKKYNYDEIVHISNKDLLKIKVFIKKKSLIWSYVTKGKFDLEVRAVYNSITNIYDASFMSLKLILDDNNLSMNEIYKISTESGMLLEVENTVIRSVSEYLNKNLVKDYQKDKIFIRLNSTNFNIKDRYMEIVNIFRKINVNNMKHLIVLFKEVEGYNDTAIINENIRGLQRFGVLVYLDDYAKGYSTLDYIFRFPFDGIKIAGSLLEKASFEKKSLLILRYILSVSSAAKKDIFFQGYDNENFKELVLGYSAKYFSGKIFKENEYL